MTKVHLLSINQKIAIFWYIMLFYVSVFHNLMLEYLLNLKEIDNPPAF